MLPSRYFIWALSKNWLKLAYVHMMVILIKFKNTWESESSCFIVITLISLVSMWSSISFSISFWVLC